MSALTPKTDLIGVLYGCIVRNALADAADDALSAARALERVGEELAHSDCAPCARFADCAAALCLALRQFLGVEATAEPQGEEGFDLLLARNPLEDNLALPEELAGFAYSSLLLGAVRGGLAAVSYTARAEFAPQTGAAAQIRVRLLGVAQRQLSDYDT